MKQLIGFLFLSLTVTSLLAQNGEVFKEKLDEKFGFRNIKLEKSFSNYPSLKFTKIEGDGKLNSYTLNSEDKKLGDYILDKVIYVTINEKIAKIIICTKGLNNSNGLLSVLQSAFGGGFKGNRSLNDYLWIADKTTMFFSINSVSNDGVAEISSNYLEKEIKDYKDEKAAKGAAEF
jgi:hypothetical protein